VKKDGKKKKKKKSLATDKKANTPARHLCRNQKAYKTRGKKKEPEKKNALSQAQKVEEHSTGKITSGRLGVTVRVLTYTKVK